MEELPKLGTAIFEVIGPTYEIYTPLLRKQEDKIRSTRCETFTYGPHDRQKLDVYTPSAGAKPVTGNANSVLVFLYGGGFIRGSKQVVPGLVYANLGHFFAENLGFEVVVVDYRLLSHGAVFPSGGEDLKLAIDWVVNRSNAQSSKQLDIYLMGNSAGGVHLSTYLLAPDFAESRRQILLNTSSTATLKAAIFLGTPFHFEQAEPIRDKDLETYFGSHIQERCPLGLLKACKQDGSIDNLRELSVLVLKGSLDPDNEILIPIADFVREWKDDASVSSNLTELLMEGHNHISPALAVGTAVPEEESWAREVVRFITSASNRTSSRS